MRLGSGHAGVSKTSIADECRAKVMCEEFKDFREIDEIVIPSKRDIRGCQILERNE